MKGIFERDPSIRRVHIGGKKCWFLENYAYVLNESCPNKVNINGTGETKIYS